MPGSRQRICRRYHRAQEEEQKSWPQHAPALREPRQLAKFTAEERRRFPLLPAYDLCLKCSHIFNLLDARGAISVTERVGVIQRVRNLAVGVARAWVDQQSPREVAATAAPV